MANKILTLTLTILLLTSLITLTVKPTNAQTTPKPSVPQFTIKLVDRSYDVPPSTTTTVDQYTGEKTTTTTPGYRVENKTIDVTIKNQPFTPYANEDPEETEQYAYTVSDKIELYYKVQVKGHFGEDWEDFISGYIVQSDSGYTVVSNVAKYAAESQLDFRAQAAAGYVKSYFHDFGFPIGSVFVVKASSDWSSIQKFTITDSSSPSSSQTSTFTANPSTTSDNNQPQQLPNQTPPPSFVFNPLFLLIIGALITVSIVVAMVIVLLKRPLKPQTTTTNQ